MVKTKLLKFFKLYELQWSRLLHFRRGREATGGLEKKKEKVVGARMGYYPFSKIESQYSRLSRHTTGSAVLWHTVG